MIIQQKIIILFITEQNINISNININKTNEKLNISNINKTKTNAKKNFSNINNIYRKYFFIKSKSKIYSHMNTCKNFRKIIKNFNIRNIKILTLNDLIFKLNYYSNFRTPKFILIFDYIYSEYCDDFNGYYLFEYYLKNNSTDVYYFINNNSKLYKSKLKNKKMKYIIPINPKVNLYKDLFYYLLNSKIIIQSYTLIDFQKMVSYVHYLKYLLLTHGIRYFKTNFFFFILIIILL